MRRRPPIGGPIHPWFKAFLVSITGLFLMVGLLLVINPEFASERWPWGLNPLDARIAAAWALGWSFWCGTMAFATDWDEIRTPTRLFLVNGVALLATIVLFRDGLTGVATPAYVGVILVLTVLMAGFHVFQERRRPRRAEAASAT